MPGWLERNKNKTEIKRLQAERQKILTEVVNGNIEKTNGQKRLGVIATEIADLYYAGRDIIFDSPIEEMLYKSLVDAEKDFSWVTDKFHILPQYEVFDGQYRLDFAIFVWLRGERVKIAVECDGYQFHEADRDQVARDKYRERRLIVDGWVVMRFSGREINDNANACVSDILRYIESQFPAKKRRKGKAVGA